MATLMPRRLIAQQGSDAKVPAEDLRLALAALFAPGVGANVARSGIVRGSGATGFTACQVLSTTASTFTIKQGAFIVQQATTNGGAYIGVVDSDQTLSIATSLPAAGNFKAGYVLAHCYDEAYGDAQDGFAIEALLGAQATTVGGAAYPTLPSNALVLSGFTVTSSGVVTLTTAPIYTGTHNGILPVLAGDTGNGIYDGQWRDEPAKGLQRWFAGANPYSGSATWARPLVNFLGSGSSFPSGAQDGDVFLRTDLGLDGGTLWVNTAHATNPWRSAESGALQVANQAGRDAISAAGVAYPGLKVVQADTGFEWAWSPVTSGWIPVTPLIGKLWRHSNFSSLFSSASGSQQIVLDSSRVGPGFTVTGTWGLVLPLDGIWEVRGSSYISGGATSATTSTFVLRTRASTADLSIAGVIDGKTDSQDRRTPFGTTGVPLKAGDTLTLWLSVASGSANYFGNGEGLGVTLEAEWKAPLNGATPL